MLMRLFYVGLFVTTVFTLSGCSDPPEILPEVNEPNCNNAVLVRGIQSPDLREKFQEDCRPFTALKVPDKPISSPPKGWGW